MGQCVTSSTFKDTTTSVSVHNIKRIRPPYTPARQCRGHNMCGTFLHKRRQKHKDKPNIVKGFQLTNPGISPNPPSPPTSGYCFSNIPRNIPRRLLLTISRSLLSEARCLCARVRRSIYCIISDFNSVGKS